MLVRILSPVLLFLTLSHQGFAADSCSEPLTVGRLSILAGDRVTWNGILISAFTEGRRRKELALLKYMIRHPNEILTYDQIIQDVFPALTSKTPEKRRISVSRVKVRLSEAFKFVPSFDALQNVNSSGYMWRDSSQTSALVNEVGNVRVTTNEVFWKGKLVPGFGAAEQNKRRALLILMDEVDQFVNLEDFAAEVELDESNVSAADLADRMTALVEQMISDFQRVESTFRALHISAGKGFMLSEAKQHVPKKMSPHPNALPQYQFRGKILKLGEGPLRVLEHLLRAAPKAVTRAKLSAASQRGALSKRSLIEYLYILRGQVGPNCIQAQNGAELVWIAPDKPEIMDAKEI